MGYFNFAGLWAAVPAFLAPKPIQIDLELSRPCTSSASPTNRTTTPSDYARSPNRNSIPPINIDVLYTILEHAVEHGPDAALLRSCALVCRSWSRPAQSLLFRTLSLRSERACASLIETVSCGGEDGRHLAANVRTLQALLDPAQPGCLRPATFARAYALCPNISSLDIALFSAPANALRSPTLSTSFDAETMALFGDRHNAMSLTFTNWAGAECGELFQLLALFPDLKHLSLRGNAPALPPTLTPARYTGAIEVLDLSIEPSPSPALFAYLLCPTALRALNFTRQPSPELLDALLATHGAHVTSLAIPALPTKCAPELHRLLGRLPGLQKLEVADPWAGASLFRRAASALPCSLTDIAIGVDDLTPLHALVEFLRPRIPRDAEEGAARRHLKRIALVLVQGGERHPLVPALKTVCEAEGLELDVQRGSK